jgi:Mu-like prophage I protein
VSDRPNLVVRRNVELLEVGEDWHTSTGDFTVTYEDLVACIAAMDDPAVRTPVLKLGHTDPRFDGEPCFGKVENLRLSENGMTLIGDYVGIPSWLDDALASAFPRRSIEGAYNLTTATGRTHQFMLTGVALLGEQYPAITTLEDIQAVYAAESIDDVVMVTVSGAQFVTATKEAEVPRPKKIDASMAVDDVRRAYYESLDSHQMWWWIRSVQLDPNELIVDDDEGSLYRVPFTVNGDSVEFGDEVEVAIVYQDKKVAASAGSTKVVYSSKEESRPGTVSANATERMQEGRMTPEQLEAIGLPADATEEQITERLNALVKLETPEDETTDPAEEDKEPVETNPGEDPSVETEPPATPQGAPVTVPQQSDAPQVLDGAVLVDAAQWEKVQSDVARANQLVEDQRRKDRDSFIQAAVNQGKFPPVMASHYRDAFDRDEKGTRQLIDLLATGAVPLTEIGHGGEVAASAAEEYPTQFLSPAEKARIKSLQEA